MKLEEIIGVVSFPIWVNDTRMDVCALYLDEADVLDHENPDAVVTYVTTDSDGYITIEI